MESCSGAVQFGMNMLKTVLRLLLRVLFRFRWEGLEHVNQPGPMVLAPNHVSWLDWLFLGVLLDDEWKFVTSSTTARTSWLHRKIMINSRTFPVDTTSAYAVRDMAALLERGGKLVIFPEGRISRTGGLMKVYDGMCFLLQRTGARLVICYLRGANRLPWVVHPGWTQWFPRVDVHFAPPVTVPEFPGLAGTLARQRVTQWVRDRMLRQQFEVEHQHGAKSVPAAVGALVRAVPNRRVLEDATFTSLTYRRVALGADVLASAWKRRLRGSGERVGVLLPNANATPVTLLSLWLTGKTPAILNFSSGVTTMLACIELAGVKQIVTSRRFVELAKLDLAPLVGAGVTLHFLEDVRAELGLLTKLGAALRNRLSPGARLRTCSLRADDTAVVLFTSGSEGVPKGVELTHGNVLANARQIDAVMDITDEERFFSALPLFHSLGLVGGLLFPLLRGCYTFLYPSPLHYRTVPTLVYEKSCTVMLATNTFLNGYARKAHPYDFSTLRYLVAGAEKVQTATFDTWARKFGVRILEGYGATECSPVITVTSRVEPRPGSAGRFLPGIEWKLEPVEGVTDGGRLWVRGPNVMKGYLNADANAKFLAGGGWYDTGDVVEVDPDGFVYIRGRMKRFAKISGEMVSLTAVEDALAGAFPVFGTRLQIAVIAVPDEEKGEKLIAVSNDARIQLADVRTVLKAKGFSNLSMPRELRALANIPKLGTGKVDHRTLREQVLAG
jgi:acyl-[acyl-carrier-protein]-phospholipid O-acyltransferase / long-chain-fatty-acid--[acyl-carrier-protein] ligase